jgi:glycosyltransferase involved in cell wall biosynthesis
VTAAGRSAPAVTVVVPTKDRSRLLSATLGSILAQRGVSIEVVVVDDGSSADEARAIRAHELGPVRVIRNEASRGVAAARNQGAQAGTGPWIGFCDDDDLWAPGKLAGQLAAAEEAGRSWVYTGAVKFADGPTVWQVMEPPASSEVEGRLADRNLIPAGASNVVVHRDAFLTAGGFDEGLGHLADWDLWLRLLEAGPPARAPGIGVAYRLHTGAMSLNPAGILDELGVLDNRWKHLRDGRPLDPAPTHLWIAMSWLRAGHRLAAARSYARAFRGAPRSGLKGILRTLHPRPPQPAHRVGPGGPAPRFKRVEHVTLSAEVLELLDTVAGTTTPGASP